MEIDTIKECVYVALVALAIVSSFSLAMYVRRDRDDSAD